MRDRRCGISIHVSGRYREGGGSVGLGGMLEIDTCARADRVCILPPATHFVQIRAGT